MKIAFLTPEFVTENYFSGGLANYVYRVSKALVAKGHKVYVFTLSEIDESVIEKDGIVVHRVKIGRLKLWLDRLTRYKFNETTKWVDLSYQFYKRLKTFHKDNPLDIVQFPNSRACGIFASLFLKIPYVIRISSYRPLWNQFAGLKRNIDTKALEWLERMQLKIAKNVYGPSQILKDILVKEVGLKNMSIIRTPFFVETEQEDESVYNTNLEGKKYLLFFGRFQLHKGFHILAQALPKVLNQFSDIHVVFVGIDTQTHLATSMKQYAKDLSVEHQNRLIFLDQTPHDQLYPIIKNACCVVLPSLIDNLPNTCLESMALARPVLGTIGASFDELIEDNVNGFLVEKENVGALENKIIEVLKHKDLDLIGQKAKATIDQLAPKYSIGLLEAYYKQVSASRKQSQGQRIAQSVNQFINNCHTGRIGEYRQSIGGDKTLYASCYAAMMLHYLGQLENYNQDVLDQWGEYINSFQDKETGLFLGPELDRSQLTSQTHDFEHLSMHLTAHVLPSLKLLNTKTKYPLTFAHAFTDIDYLEKWLNKIDWKRAWFEGNNLLFIGQFLIYLRDDEAHPKAAEALEFYFQWLDKQMDPATGLWGTNGFCSNFEAMCGGYHQLLVYYYENRDTRFQKQLIDVVLDLQHSDGGFAPRGGGGACEDVDAIDILVNMYKQVDYRRKDIRIALRKAYHSIIGKQMEDGGFVYRLDEDFVHMGMIKTASKVNTSNMFATWFRLHTLALISQIINEVPMAQLNLQFNDSCSMGWHKPASVHSVSKSDVYQECVTSMARDLSSVKWYRYKLRPVKRLVAGLKK